MDREVVERVLAGFKDKWKGARTHAEKVAAVRSFVFDIFRPGLDQEGKRDFAAKTPAMIVRADTLFEIFPEAKFIHVIRDGRDVVSSMIATRRMPIRIRKLSCFSRDPLARLKFLRFSIRNAVIFWREALLEGRAKGKSLPADQYLEVRMEDLMAEDSAMKRVCEFLGVAYYDDLLKFLDPSRSNRGRWRKSFSEKDVEVFKKESGALLIELGYEENDQWTL